MGFLRTLIREYQSMPYDVDIVVLSNIPKNIGPDIEVIVGLPTKDPWSLPFGHKELFAKRVDKYDLFIYSEDDTLITARNIGAFLEVTEVLPKEKIAGFLRYESAPDGTKYYSTVHAHYHWDPDSVLKSGKYVFARYTNDHSGCYLLTKKQLKAALASGGFLQGPREGRYDLLVTAATDPYSSCGMQKMICISHIQDFALHHLPDKYCGAIGVEASAVEKEIQALLRLPGSDAPRRRLIRTETKLSRAHWDKRYYDPARTDVLGLVPKNAKTVLSIGCGAGSTEAVLTKAGIQVTGVPLDEIIAVSARSRGIDVTPPDFGLARKQLEGRRFDVILFSDILHLVPDPVALMEAFFPYLSTRGAVLVSVPNFNHAWVLRRMVSGDRELRELKRTHDFERFGVHRTTLGTLKNWLARCGLVMSAVCTDVAPHRRRLSRMTLKAFDRFLTDNIVVLARPGYSEHPGM
jgi:2-polyprenyl-3-methyl-5-hydroxy-6-metoxy-1,4-benzoquinol methylase